MMLTGENRITGRTKVLSVPLLPPQILHGLAWDRTRVLKVIIRLLNALCKRLYTVPFITSLNTVAISHRKPASARNSSDKCCDQGPGKWDIGCVRVFLCRENPCSGPIPRPRKPVLS